MRILDLTGEQRQVLTSLKCWPTLPRSHRARLEVALIVLDTHDVASIKVWSEKEIVDRINLRMESMGVCERYIRSATRFLLRTLGIKKGTLPWNLEKHPPMKASPEEKQFLLQHGSGKTSRKMRPFILRGMRRMGPLLPRLMEASESEICSVIARGDESLHKRVIEVNAVLRFCRHPNAVW